MPEYTNTWFKGHEANWKRILGTYSFENCLEIGSYEGQSTLGILSLFPKSNITCIDTWKGEEQGYDEDYTPIKQRFENNIASVKHKVTILETTSADGLVNLLYHKKQFDLVYIDGSHHSADVMVDAVLSFRLLKVGGIIVFDDYGWNTYKEPHLLHKNPKFAIDSFLCAYFEETEVLSKGWQVFVKKTKNR